MKGDKKLNQQKLFKMQMKDNPLAAGFLFARFWLQPRPAKTDLSRASARARKWSFRVKHEKISFRNFTTLQLNE